MTSEEMFTDNCIEHQWNLRQPALLCQWILDDLARGVLSFWMMVAESHRVEGRGRGVERH